MNEPIIIYPAGYIGLMDYAPFGVSIIEPLQTPGLIARTTGVYPLNYGLCGTQGTIEASFTVGAAGSGRLLVFLVDQWPSPTKYIGIGLDSSNRPYALMSVDGLGTVYGQSSPTLPAFASGTSLTARLSYNLRSPLYETRTAVIQVNDETEGDWVPDPVVTAYGFTPGALVVGLAGLSLAAFNGAVRWVQACGDAEIEVVSLPVEESLLATLSASSSASFQPGFVLPIDSGATGESDFTSDLGLEIGYLPLAGGSTFTPVLSQSPDSGSITTPVDSFGWAAHSAQTVAGACHDPDGDLVRAEAFEGLVSLGYQTLLGSETAYSIDVADCGDVRALSITVVLTDAQGLTRVLGPVSGSVV